MTYAAIDWIELPNSTRAMIYAREDRRYLGLVNEALYTRVVALEEQRRLHPRGGGSHAWNDPIVVSFA